ncbi:MAG: class I SAM-dependent methyltransferase [Bernardetiaceae bacterium]|jgi:SAM-dependent methyltransferase|nr:class I SAM-dependent methyltransferase [Bernardetiaceae bacterium]
MNATNIDFYRRIDIGKFKEFADRIGLGASCDVDEVYPFVKEAKLVYELGAGYGRVASALYRKGFQGRIVALERSPELVGYLRKHLPQRITVRQDDYLHFRVGERPDAFLWMWSGVLELSPEEQRHGMAYLARKLRPGGRLIAEIPVEIKVVGEMIYNGFIKVQTDWGSFEGYLPTHEQMMDYAYQAGFGRVTRHEYYTSKRIRRCFYVLEK